METVLFSNWVFFIFVSPVFQISFRKNKWCCCQAKLCREFCGGSNQLEKSNCTRSIRFWFAQCNKTFCYQLAEISISFYIYQVSQLIGPCNPGCRNSADLQAHRMSLFDSLWLFLPLRPWLLAEMVPSFQNFTRIILILTFTFPLVLVLLHKIWLMKFPLCSGLTVLPK